MTHEDVRSREIVDAYVRGKLSGEERAAFEDHCFDCQECFDELLSVQDFADGMRHAVESGTMGAASAAGIGQNWWQWGFLAACAASLLLGAALVWMVGVEQPRLQADLARQRQAADSARREAVEMARAARAPGMPVNLPLLMLEASRGESKAVIALNQEATQVALWVEPPPASQPASYRMEIRTAAGASVLRIEGLARNAQGALLTTVPAEKVPPGDYRVALLLTIKGKQDVLVGDYQFEIRRQ